MPIRPTAVAWLITFLLSCAGFAREGQGKPSSLASGPEPAKQLAARVSVSWSNLPLSRALKSLSAAQHLPITLDRRVDPGQPITLALDDIPLDEALEKIAAHLKIGYCQFGPLAYFGPGKAAKRLRTLAALRLEELKSLSPATSRKFLVRDWRWDALAEPRQLVAELAREAEVEMDGIERIPHDLWPECDWPLLAWIDRLTLVAAQFDLEFHIEPGGKRVKLVAIPDDVALARTYQVPRDASAVAKRWSKLVPAAQVAAEKNKIRVTGRIEDHELIEKRMRGVPSSRTTVTAGKEVYQLAVENAALSRVVDQLGDQLNLQFEWNREAIDQAGITVDQLVSVKVQGVSLDELLRAVFAGTGLTFKRSGTAIEIFPDKKR